MMRVVLVALLLSSTGCGNTQVSDEQDGPPLEAPVSGPSAYVILSAPGVDAGWDALDAMNSDLSPPQRGKIQARGLVSGKSGDMMIRFAGRCASDAAFVDAVRTVAVRHGVTGVRCDAALPDA